MATRSQSRRLLLSLNIKAYWSVCGKGPQSLKENNSQLARSSPLIPPPRNTHSQWATLSSRPEFWKEAEHIFFPMSQCLCWQQSIACPLHSLLKKYVRVHILSRYVSMGAHLFLRTQLILLVCIAVHASSVLHTVSNTQMATSSW